MKYVYTLQGNYLKTLNDGASNYPFELATPNNHGYCRINICERIFSSSKTNSHAESCISKRNPEIIRSRLETLSKAIFNIYRRPTMGKYIDSPSNFPSNFSLGNYIN